MHTKRDRKLLFILLFFLAGAPIFAQVSGSITASQCVSIGVGNSTSTVGIQVAGTWTGTLQPQIAIQGQAPVNAQVTPSTSSTAQSTITANGVYYANVAGGSTFYVCGNTVATGTATVYLNVSQGVSTGTLGSGGGGSGTVSSCAAAGNAYYSGSGTTVSCDTSIVDSGTGNLAFGAATPVLSTTTANAPLTLAPNGTGAIVTNVGTAANPTMQATGSATNTGLNLTTTLECWTSVGAFVACLNANGVEVGSNKSLIIGSTGQANSSQALGIGTTVQGSNTYSFDTTTGGNEAGMIRTADACKPTTALTLTSSAQNWCSWSLPASTKVWNWKCEGTYSMSAGSSPTLVMDMNASQAPGTEVGNGVISTVSAGTAIVQTNGTGTSASTGPQTIMTSGAITTPVTNAYWSSSGMISASATAGTFAIQFLTAVGTGTINAGSVCWMF